MPEADAPDFRAFHDRDALADAVGGRVEAALRGSLQTRGRALLAVSGGTTPAPAYRRLSKAPIAWDQVDVVLVDERWVEPGEPGSNQSFVEAALLQDNAAAARLTGLKTSAADPFSAIADLESRLAALPWPIDAAVLGLGADGHTASWFPHADGLEEALRTDGPRVAAIRARPSGIAGAHLLRVTLTLGALAGCPEPCLMIAGEDKRIAIRATLEPGPVADRPARALFTAEGLAPTVFWSP